MNIQKTTKLFVLSIGMLVGSLFLSNIHGAEATTSGGSATGLAWSGSATATQWAAGWLSGTGLVGKFKNECSGDMVDNAGNTCFVYVTSWAGSRWFGATHLDNRWCKYTTGVRTWGTCSASGIQYATSYNYNTIYGTTSCTDQAPASRGCTPSCSISSWTPGTATVCSGTNFTQTSNCGTTRSVGGAKSCPPPPPACTVSSWTPDPATICSGTRFTQTSDCRTTRGAIGTKDCSCHPTSTCGAANTICSGQTCNTGCATVTGTMNCTPTVPSITGAITGYINTNYDFTATSTDPNGDTLRYGFDWGSDSGVDTWAPASGYLASGAGGTLPRQWSSTGAQVLRAMACDNAGHCSAWSGNHTITLRSHACTGTNPPTAHSVFCSGSDSGLTVDVVRKLFPSCSSNKCAFICDSGSAACGGTTYIYNATGPKCDACTRNCTCAETTCIGKTCSDTCGGTVSGTKDCRDLNWREVAPN